MSASSTDAVRCDGSPLADLAASLPATATEAAGAAAAAILQANHDLPPVPGPLVRMVRRAEAVASAQIDGIRTSVADVAIAELDPRTDPAATRVAGTVNALTAAVSEAHESRLTAATLHRWHRAIVGDDSGHRGRPGRFRASDGWMGDTRPRDARYKAPPADRVGPLMEDLIAFANRDDVEAVTQAALTQARFEVVSPYTEGNGRVARVLAGWVLTRRLRLVTPPPIAVRMALDVDRYVDGVVAFRDGEAPAWVSWFATTVADAAGALTTLARSIAELEQRWLDALSQVRAHANARWLLPRLPEELVFSNQTASAALGTSARSGRNALSVFVSRGLVQPFGPALAPRVGRPRQWWVAHELVELVETWACPEG